MRPVSELLGHISDVLPDNAFNKIDTAKWNAVSALVGAAGVEPLRKQVVPETLVVPDGYALMPIEPTTGICKAAADGWLDCGSKMVLNKAGAAYRSSVAYFMKKGTQS